MMRLIPQPLSVTENTGAFVKASDFTVTRKTLSVKQCDESYSLYIKADGITICASSEKGFFYAEKTLEQIISFYGDLIPVCTVNDSPRFEYRGFMIDCARHMFSVDELKKMIDVAASLKFNRFHWHLADDQGFRIELKCYPELTRLGSVRAGDRFGKNLQSDKPYGGFYTQKDISGIVDFCRKRFIDVIPELDVPGHSSALLHVFPELGCGGKNVSVKMSNGIFKDVLCVGEEKTETVIRNIVSELCELFPGEYFHIGGDEVPRDNWKNCPKCRSLAESAGIHDLDGLQQLFINSVAAFLQEKGKTVIGWNECLKGGKLNGGMVIERWLDPKGLAVKAANNGRKIIAAPLKPYYADYPYAINSLKKVYLYEPTDIKGLTESGKENVIGTESPIWTEFINSCASLEAHCFPRWFAVAESAWSIPENKSYREFASASVKLCEALHSRGINCTLPSGWNPTGIKRLCESAAFLSNFSTTGK